MAWNLPPERQMNLFILRGEQDSTNMMSYSERARDTKDHIKDRGAKGRKHVSILEWSEQMGNVQITDGALAKFGVQTVALKQMEHVVYMCMKNYTAGHAKEVIQYGVCNGVDAWRKFFRDQLQLAECKRSFIVMEFVRPKERANASGVRHCTLGIERPPVTWEWLSDRPFDGEAKMRKVAQTHPCWHFALYITERTQREDMPRASGLGHETDHGPKNDNAGRETTQP